MSVISSIALGGLYTRRLPELAKTLIFLQKGCTRMFLGNAKEGTWGVVHFRETSLQVRGPDLGSSAANNPVVLLEQGSGMPVPGM